MSNSETNKIKENMSLKQFNLKWQKELQQHLPSYFDQTTRFLHDENFGLKHSYDVWTKAQELAGKVETYENKSLNREAIEYMAVFHDMGKFFQEFHSLENIQIAEQVFHTYASIKGIAPDIEDLVIDGIRCSDYYNKRLDPSSIPPKTIEGEVVRAADKMLYNLVAKVDRYWYEYGVSRKAKFFDPTLTFSERKKFSFDNFLGDQLNVILSILGLRPEDFSQPILQEEYKKWSQKPKEKVVSRIIDLAREIGESSENIEKISLTIFQYRKTFDS